MFLTDFSFKIKTFPTHNSPGTSYCRCGLRPNTKKTMDLLNTVAGISVFTVQRPLFKIDRGHKRENKEHLQLEEQINMFKYSQKCWGGS